MSERALIKCCGMFREEDIAAVNAARPDMVGFVVDFPKSHRSVTPERLGELARQVAQGITRVGVFVDEPIAQVAALVEAGLLDAVQLHGHEDEAYIEELRFALGWPKSIHYLSATFRRGFVIQAFRVRVPEDVTRAKASSADMILLDNGQGTGESFDWSLVKQVSRPFMLAGGLGQNNVAQAIAAVHPWAVDMSSGLETDKLKDPSKIAAAVMAVRGSSMSF